MLRLKNINKGYKTQSFTQNVLKDINLNFRNNEFVSILGPSGSGKTTLLNIIGGLDRYDSGDLIINGKSTKNFKNKDWDAYRNNSIGFIFQSYNLISHMTILSNVELCMTLSGVSQRERRKRATEALEKVGLKDHIHKKPNQLSGGQMQRVAIARALVNNPDIILADEPTGALDSKTSVQIMELIKEIAKDKLVIMVTHNPELAEKYSTRIIKIKDGIIIEDTNPLNEEDIKEEYKLNKTSMNFFTALKLSFNNILTKKGRTLLTAFASSIGIMGIALILSLSNGFKIQIDKFEKDTLSQAPIIISEQSMNMDSINANTDKEELEEYTNKKEIYPLKSMSSNIHVNKLTKEYMEYINNIDKDLIGGISYQRIINLNLLTKINEKVKYLNSAELLFPLPTNLDGSISTVIEDNFEIIDGKITDNMQELLLLVDTKNRVSEDVLKLLGYEKEDKINFDELLGKEFKVILNDDFYTNSGLNYVPSSDYEKLYNSESAITLKVSAIIRGKEGSDFAKLSGSGFVYKESLMNYVIDKNDNSNIVKDQINKDYNVITMEKFDLSTDEGKKAKEQVLSYLGSDTVPVYIQIYPKDFDSKDELIKYLDKYNKGKIEEDKILYIDQAELITSMSGSIMDAITIVLIAFSGISLIVSTIMIGIIIYISVLERTKEIGILRAIGARKKDITRVFNAETFIIGLSSGLIGIICANLLTIPINNVIENLSDLPNVAQLNILHAIILIIISVVLTTIGGLIPAKMASKKDPVESLRVE
ncbi:MAG: ATP-binding cassette domain-containing protein [Bacilli bacterium]|nr:ATP-binding cassette domain-containing protein [Bacilli bacterium]